MTQPWNTTGYQPPPLQPGQNPYQAEPPTDLYAGPPQAPPLAVVPPRPGPPAPEQYLYQPAPPQATAKPDPAEWGWRRAVRRASGGAVKLRPGVEESMYRAALQAIGVTFPAPRTIVVANFKGGAGKTPTALILSGLLSELRREPVVAWDNNELHGTLGLRAENHEPRTTVVDLLRQAKWLSRQNAEAGDLAGLLRRQPEGHLVLASSESSRVMEQIGEAECSVVHQLLRRRYTTVVVDTGNNGASPNFLYAIRHADVLVLPTGPSDSHLRLASMLLEQLGSDAATQHLIRKTVMVVTSPTGGHLAVDAAQHFGQYLPHIVPVVPDPVIAENKALPLSRLSVPSRRAWTLVAAAVAETAAQPSVHDADELTAQPEHLDAAATFGTHPHTPATASVSQEGTA